jgi:hypothetical protein
MNAPSTISSTLAFAVLTLSTQKDSNRLVGRTTSDSRSMPSISSINTVWIRACHRRGGDWKVLSAIAGITVWNFYFRLYPWKWYCKIGVCPLRDHVRHRCGRSLRPLSSTKTIV